MLTRGRLHPSRSTQEACRELDGTPPAQLPGCVRQSGPVCRGGGVLRRTERPYSQSSGRSGKRTAACVLQATCNPECACEPGSKPKWRTEYTKCFNDKGPASSKTGRTSCTRCGTPRDFDFVALRPDVSKTPVPRSGQFPPLRRDQAVRAGSGHLRGRSIDQSTAPLHG